MQTIIRVTITITAPTEALAEEYARAVLLAADASLEDRPTDVAWAHGAEQFDPGQESWEQIGLGL